MSFIAIDELYLRVRARCVRTVRTRTLRRCLPALLAALAVFAVSPVRAQTFDPSLTIGGGIQTNYQHDDLIGVTDSDTFTLNHARVYLSGTITDNVSYMFNTDYSSTDDKLDVLDAVGEFSATPMFNVWFGRFLPPSDRDNYTGPFYANEWLVYTDGIQDGYPFVFQGRDNGLLYWGDFKAGIAKIKVSAGAFDGGSATGDKDVLWAGRVQVDLWDPEGGYYLNSTYYGDKNLLAFGVASQDQSGKTATTADFLLEKKVMNGGAFTVESEYSRYNALGGYNANYIQSEGAYGLASFLFPKVIGIGKFEVLGKYAIAEFTDGLKIPDETHHFPSYRQNTTEVNIDYIIKQFDARVMGFYENLHFNGVERPSWEAGVGMQLQISKTVH